MASRTILIVDTHRGTVELLQAALATHGFPSEVAFDHDHALNIIKCFDHVALFSEYGLFDHCIPQMNPRRFLEQVRAIRPSLLIVLMCKNVFSDQAKSEEGVVTVLEKPLDVEELHRTIQRCADEIAELPPAEPPEVPRP